MSGFKHTPGPWAIDDESIVDPKRFAVAEVHWSQLYVDYDKSRHPSDDPDWSRELSDAEMEANARLISKAPEMAESLECAERWFRGAGMTSAADHMAGILADIKGESQ